jgi:hypothetical protein
MGAGALGPVFGGLLHPCGQSVTFSRLVRFLERKSSVEFHEVG